MRILILSFTFLLSIYQLYGEVYQIEVHLMNQTIIECELVSITDSSLSIAFFVDPEPDSSGELPENIYFMEVIKTIPNDSILKVVIPGELNIIDGVAIGFGTGLLGTVIAMLLSSDEGGREVLAISDRTIVAIIGLFGTVVLTIAGGVIGAIDSTSEIIIEPYPNPDIKLDPYARYPRDPEFLKE